MTPAQLQLLQQLAGERLPFPGHPGWCWPAGARLTVARGLARLGLVELEEDDAGEGNHVVRLTPAGRAASAPPARASVIRPSPCDACPYRRDVASGVWHPEEYAKLPPYDRPTQEQPLAAFLCHATPAHYCHGWAVVHSGRGHAHQLLALRVRSCGEVPPAAVPLFSSGAEAAEHGMREVVQPSARAVRTAAQLLARHPRLREQRGRGRR